MSDFVVLILLLFGVAMGVVVLYFLLRGSPNPNPNPSPSSSSSPSSSPSPSSPKVTTEKELRFRLSQGGTIELGADLVVSKSLYVSQSRTRILGNGHRLTLDPSAGTVALLLIADPTFFLSHRCATSCTDWSNEWLQGISIQDVSIENLELEGNFQAGVSDQSRSEEENALGTLCSSSCQKTPIKGTNMPVQVRVAACAALEKQEQATDLDAFALFGVQPSLDSCAATGRVCEAEDLCGDIKASVVTVLNAGGVVLRNLQVSKGRSAAISAFFGCTKLHMLNCQMCCSTYDGFGPDSLRDAILENCRFQSSGQETHAAISVSAGRGDAVPQGWYGPILLKQVSIPKEWAIGVFVNSPNKYVIEGGSNAAAVQIQLSDGASAGAMSAIVTVPQKCSGPFKHSGLPNYLECYAPQTCTLYANMPSGKCPPAPQ